MEEFIQKNKLTIILSFAVIIFGFSTYQFIRISNFVTNRFEENREYIDQNRAYLENEMAKADVRHEAATQSMKESMDFQSRLLSNPESLEGHPEWERMVREAEERKKQRDIAFEKRKQELIAAEKAKQGHESIVPSTAQDDLHVQAQVQQ